VKVNSLSRRERERLFRKNEIISASVKLFAERGFDATTLDDIALAAEFGKGTIYNYFSGKEEIYSAIVDEVSTNLSSIIQETDGTTSSAREFLIVYTRKIFNYCLENKEAFVLFVREIVEFTTDVFALHKDKIMKRQKSSRKILIDNIESGIKSGEFVEGEPEKIANIFQHLVFPYILFLIETPARELNVKEETDLILGIFFNGILTNNNKRKR
jgi:AcrR family transcriptional regulator